MLSNKAWYLIGAADVSFAIGEIDQGIHETLPGTLEDGTPVNECFRPLNDRYEAFIREHPRDRDQAHNLQTILRQFAKDHDPSINFPGYIVAGKKEEDERMDKIIEFLREYGTAGFSLFINKRIQEDNNALAIELSNGAKKLREALEDLAKIPGWLS